MNSLISKLLTIALAGLCSQATNAGSANDPESIELNGGPTGTEQKVSIQLISKSDKTVIGFYLDSGSTEIIFEREIDINLEEESQLLRKFQEYKLRKAWIEDDTIIVLRSNTESGTFAVHRFRKVEDKWTAENPMLFRAEWFLRSELIGYGQVVGISSSQFELNLPGKKGVYEIKETGIQEISNPGDSGRIEPIQISKASRVFPDVRGAEIRKGPYGSKW